MKVSFSQVSSAITVAALPRPPERSRSVATSSIVAPTV